jgi:hypothetical protein
VNLRYLRAREDADVEENSSNKRRQRARSSGSGTGRRRGRPPLGWPRDMLEEERRTSDSLKDK